ncbi:MAG: Na+/H+ antiporter NhaC family protein [Lachnospiraceae bacterium]|nr:Na+/H+ antiporter NhaC family protein [Lachnospiraceae bacterium]
MNKNRVRWLFTFLASIAVCLLASPVIVHAAEDAAEAEPTGNWWALLPAIVAIVLALITKEVYSSLFVGILIGGALWSANYFEGNFFEGLLTHVVEDGFIGQIADSYNVGILVFLVILGILVALMNKSGGSAAFGRWAETHIKTRIGAQLATIALGVLIFIDDYFNCLTVGSVMRPVTDKHKVSRAKLAFLIDATAAPICIIAPISSWAAAVSGFVPGEDGFQVFLQAIPYNYYAILMIVMMVTMVLLKTEYGSMKLHEQNAILNGDLYTTPDRPYENKTDAAQNGKGTVLDLVLPVIVLIVCCAGGMIYSGLREGGEGIIGAFSSADASVGLALGSLVALVVAIVFYLARRVVSFKECMDCVPEGFKAMVPAIFILTFAWTLKAMTDSLFAKQFVAAAMEGVAGDLLNFLPAVIFLVAVGLAFATGTSWGTFGILIPIVVNIFDGKDHTMMILSISACMAGAVCGDHCSPISDTTIMSSAGGQCNHINHVNTQLPYALTCAGVSFVGYIIAGLAHNLPWFVPFIINIALMIAVILLLRDVTGDRKKEKAAAK